MEKAIINSHKDNAYHLDDQGTVLSWGDPAQFDTAIQILHKALQSVLPILTGIDSKRRLQPEHNSSTIGKKIGASSPVSVEWLMNKLQNFPSELTPERLAIGIIEASQITDAARQQEALFDILGASDEAILILMEVTPLIDEIRKNISVSQLDNFIKNNNNNRTITTLGSFDAEEQRRQNLLDEAMSAADVAAVAQADYEELIRGLNVSTNASTHTVVRTSHIEAKKLAEKAAKRATQAMKRALDAGVVLDSHVAQLIGTDKTAGFGDAGLLNKTSDELMALQLSLLPEGSRQNYDNRGLPLGAIREETDTFEKVVIPAMKRHDANIDRRLKISDIIPDEELARAFEGTKSLNPMQSKTFEVVFHSRDNALICAPVSSRPHAVIFCCHFRKPVS